MTVLSLDGVENQENVFHVLRTLDIASAFVVDKDYLLPYTGPMLKDSSDARGFLRYAPNLEPDTVAEHLFPRESDRLKLLTLLMDNHSAAIEMLEKNGFLLLPLVT